jgi:transmembrane sensor
LEGDRRRPGALLRAQAGLEHIDRARAFGADGLSALEDEQAPPKGLSRRAMLGTGAAIAASAVAAVGLGIWSRTPALDYESGRGEIRAIALSDGSAMTLDAASSARVVMASDRRGVTLRSGRALFDVAHDAARPFIVAAGETRVRAVGTSFSVDRRAYGALEIVMREGLIEVTTPSAARPQSVAAGRIMIISAAGAVHVGQADEAAIESALAWQHSMIVLDGVSLKDAAAEFARYSDYAIMVDPAVANLRVTGRYSAFDAKGFAFASAASLGINADLGATAARLRP